jgi:hypothetical protein
VGSSRFHWGDEFFLNFALVLSLGPLGIEGVDEREISLPEV